MYKNYFLNLFFLFLKFYRWYNMFQKSFLKKFLKKIFKKKNLFFKKKYNTRVIVSKRLTIAVRRRKKKFFKKFKKKNFGNFFVKKFFLKSLYKNRNLFRIFFYLNKRTRQKKINKLIFKKSKKFFKKNTYEYSLMNILLRSHMFFFIKDALVFIKEGFIFLNGLVVKNYDFFLKCGDRVQININSNFFKYIKSCRKFFKKKVAIIRYESWKYFRKKYYQRRKYFRLKKKKNPKHYLLFFIYKLSVPKFLEIDLLSLTVIILKKIDIEIQNTYFLNKLFSYKLFCLYNFKKIN